MNTWTPCVAKCNSRLENPSVLDKKFFNSKTKLSSYLAKVWRTVETQETAATLNIVDSMEEQGILESLLDEIKPKYRPGTEGMHYLLKTAFRYPPLQHGSRFGTRLLPSFFYASENILTNLAETAYYRFIFLSDMQKPYTQAIDSKHSVFSVSVRSNACLDLCEAKYQHLSASVTSFDNYQLTQSIGTWAIENKVEIIRFESARLPDNINVAIAEPQSIRSKAPLNLQTWLCRTSHDRISFSSREAKAPIIFNKALFLHDGVLPKPA